jgi:MFS transporter, putative metabolite:H+ symporter
VDADHGRIETRTAMVSTEIGWLIAERVGREAVYLISTIPVAIGAYEFGQSSDRYAMLGWTCLFLFCASGAAPAYKMWYAERYPTPIRATGQATVEPIGGRLFGGVILTFFFPIIVSGYGMGATMTVLADMAVITSLMVVVFAPETYRRSVEDLEAAAITLTETTAAENPAQAG